METDGKSKGIKAWAEEDRPREKLLHKGRKALTNAELLAIILGSGSRDESAVALAKRMLISQENNLNNLSKLGVADLCTFKGVGEAKAVSVIACLELGRRIAHSTKVEMPQITSSDTAYKLLHPSMGDLDKEVCKVISLNKKNSVIQIKTVSEGGIDGTVVDPRVIFKAALDCKATGIIVAHNHPSGSLEPSQADRNVTSQLADGGRLLNIRVLDHIIITDSGFFSFMDEGLL